VQGLKPGDESTDAGEDGRPEPTSVGGTDMRRMQIHHRPSRRDDQPRPGPLDPRDPDVLRAKQLKRAASQPGKHTR